LWLRASFLRAAKVASGRIRYTVFMERNDHSPAASPIQWPPFRVDEKLPEPKQLVLAWKPLIDGWDIVLGRQVVEAPEQFSHWLPMLPKPE
jgi:hypothetical protein